MSKFIISGFADEISTSIDEQIAAFTKMGISNIVLRFVDGENIADISLDKAKEVKRKLDANGIAVSSLGSPIGKVNVDSAFADEMLRLIHVLELAKVFNTQFIRMFSFYPPEGSNFDDYTDKVIDRLGAMSAVASSYGVTLIHENEKDIYGDTAERCFKILSALDKYGLKAAFDMANFVQCDISPLEAFKMLQPHIGYMHVKDALFSDHSIVVPGEGDGQIREILALLASDGQNRNIFVSLEPHLGNFAGLATLEKDAAPHITSKPAGGAPAFSTAHEALTNIIKSL